VVRPVTVFCGKGGVGKTALSLAFALRQAGEGRRVLVITSHPLPELALSVSLAGLKESNPVAAANLFVIHVDPKEVLRDLVRQNAGSLLLADTVLSSRVYRSLIEVLPGVKEIAFVSRVRDLAVRGSGPEAPQGFDRMVWDAPATGHFLRTIEVARGFDSHLSGPLAMLGKSLAGFLSNPASLTLIPVTTLEEMAVDEAIELCEKLTAGLQMRPAALVCNMTSPLLGTSNEEWERLRKNFLAEVAGPPEASFILERHAIERTLFARLRLASGIPTHIVRRKPGGTSDVGLLLDLAAEMGGLPGESVP
jgi:arsenite/tail-anchored protein-transporting ATPase